MREPGRAAGAGCGSAAGRQPARAARKPARTHRPCVRAAEKEEKKSKREEEEEEWEGADDDGLSPQQASERGKGRGWPAPARSVCAVRLGCMRAACTLPVWCCCCQ